MTLSSKRAALIAALVLSGCATKEPVSEKAPEPARTAPPKSAPKSAPNAAENDEKSIAESGADTHAVSPSSKYGRISDQQEEIFFGSAEDPPPKVLDAQLEQFEGRHFLISDEENPDKYYEKIKDLGGGFAGVGTDQCYLFIGWTKPELAWLSDYDPWVVYLHWAYLALFEANESHEDFVAGWHPKNKETAVALLEKVYADHLKKKQIVEVFEKAHQQVYGRLNRLRRHLEERKIPGFVADQESYAFVRDLILAKRVRPLVGNLLAENGLQGIAAVSKALKVPLRALYISNAESYWSYTEQFKENMYAMNFDDRSLIMRTMATKPRNGDYCYSTQSAKNFVEWLQQPFVRKVNHIWQRDRFVREEDEILFSHIDEPPNAPVIRKQSN